MRTATWYFDFVSPFAFIAFRRLSELPAGLDIELRPVLFAGLLNHFGQKGPAEIPEKRRHTYRYSHWWAHSLGIPLVYPAGHPFNPLHHLRLAIAAGPTRENVGRIFDALWTTGVDPTDAVAFKALATSLGVSPDQLGTPDVKDTLRRNTDEAIARGVFGVPTLVVEGECFWGADAMDMAKAFLADRSVVHNTAMLRLDALPIAAARRA